MTVLLRPADAGWVVNIVSEVSGSEHIAATSQKKSEVCLDNLSQDAESIFEQKSLERFCASCGNPIELGRLSTNPMALRCVSCQEVLETRNPGASKRKIDEGFAGTREDHRRMRGRQFSDMRKRNYE